MNIVQEIVDWTKSNRPIDSNGLPLDLVLIGASGNEYILRDLHVTPLHTRIGLLDLTSLDTFSITLEFPHEYEEFNRAFKVKKDEDK